MTSDQVYRNVLERDNRRCQDQDCGRGMYVEIHHVVARSHGGETEEKNLICLCPHCHRGKDKGAGAHTHEARKRHLNYLREKYGYKYTERKYLEALEEMDRCPA